MGPYGTETAWPSKPQPKISRTHNHHISLRERIKDFQNRTQEKHPKAEEGAHATTKAAAWAVFQHHGGGGVGLSQTRGDAVRRPTRFKIEAQMKHEIARPSVSESMSVSESVAASWDAGSTLFDSFELDSLLKTLDQAANTAAVASQQKQTDEEAGAIVVYSQKHWVARPSPNPPPQRKNNNRLQSQRSFPGLGALENGRLDTVDEMHPLKTQDNIGQRPVSYKLAGNLTLDDLYKQGQGQEDADSDPFANFGHTPSPFNVRRNARRSFDSSLQEKSGKGGSLHHRSKWKSLLHTLHLDSASSLLNRFQGFHAQVAPHDSHKKLENKASRSRAKAEAAKSDQTNSSYSPKHSIVSASEVPKFDPRFDPKNLHISKDVHPPAVKDDHPHSPPAHSWKSGLKAVFSRPFSRQASSKSEESGASPKQTPLAALEAPRKSGVHSGQKKADLQSAWSSLTTKLQHLQDGEEPRSRGQRAQSLVETVSLSHHEHHHHYHHHHHHVPVPPEAADYELTVQAISRRVSRSSFEEKLARKFSIEEDGRKAPRNSLATPRSSGDSSAAAYEERARARLTPWEAESSLSKGAFVH